MALRSVFQRVTKVCNSPLSLIAAKNNARDYSNKFLNHVELLGRVGKEPMRVGQNDAVAFPLFTETVLKLKDGTLKSYPTWHRVLVPKKTVADTVFEVLERGQRCFISGRIAYKAGEVTETGKTIHSNQAIIICDNIIFLEKSRKQAEESAEGAAAVPQEAAIM